MQMPISTLSAYYPDANSFVCLFKCVCISTTLFPGDLNETKEVQETQVCIWRDQIARSR